MFVTSKYASSKDNVSELILKGLGGAENISDVDCCATRLRVTVKASDKVNDSYLKKLGYRDVTYKDIVILLRAPKAAGTVYQRILQSEGIPAAVDTGDGYFSAWEIQIMVSMLHVVDNPLQDIPLLAVMKAPFFDFSEDELAILRMLHPKDYFYHCVTQAAEIDVEL